MKLERLVSTNLHCSFVVGFAYDVVYLQAVRRDNKQRFSLVEEDGELLIRANQGHSITVRKDS